MSGGDFVIRRRTFLAGLGAATAGLALGLHRAHAGKASTVAPVGGVFLGTFIQIDTAGQVTIVCHRSEMGQGVRSSLPVLIADELGADPAKIHIVQADGDVKYGDQNTDGSSSVRGVFTELRAIGAAARAMLIAAAAKRWKVPAARLVAHDDAVHDPTTKKSLAFGDLVLAAAKVKPPKNPALRPLEELTHLGKDLPLRDGDAYVTGQAQFGADVTLPGMLVAVVARPPANLDTVAAFDEAAAKAVPGVRHVVKLPEPTPPLAAQPLGGVAVVADHTWAAIRGRRALAATFDAGPNADYDSATYTQALLEAVRAPGQAARTVGDAATALDGATTRVEAEYVAPHLVHAPMEPPAALARVNAAAKTAEIWACTQSPQDAQEAVATALGFKPADVTVHVTFLGGGFGRKSIPDYCIEAALLAREVGAPVRVQWTREDEIRHAYYHTHAAQALAAGLDGKGELVAWRHRIAYPSISATFAPDKVRPSDGELGQGVLDLPLAIPNVAVETGLAPQKVRIGWMRSVCNVPQAFAVQSFVDELAHATKRDMRDMLLAVLGPVRTIDEAALGVKTLRNYGAKLTEHPIDITRYHRVIEKVTEMADWDVQRKAGRALGLAVHRSFLSYIGVVVSVEKGPRGELRVDEAWIVGDAGIVVNADRVKSQLEGAVIFGMSAGLYGAITMKNGAVVQSNFRDYPMVRMPSSPRAIHTALIDSKALPGGVGEPGVPPVAPAIANAIFALTGERRRTLPLARR